MKNKLANMNNYIRSLRYAKRLFWNFGTPLYLIFFITSRCNLKCKHCFFWKELNREENALTLEEIEKISKQMDNLPYLRITGGEPSLRSDFADIAEIFYRNNKLLNLGLNTNGFLTDRIIIGVKQILESCPDLNVDVCVSIDDIGNRHDEHRGVQGTYDKAVMTLKELNKLTIRYPRLKSVIGVDINKSNQGRIKEIYEEIVKLNVSYICDTIIRGDARDSSVKDVDIGKYKKFTELVRNYNKQRTHQAYIDINAKDEFIAETVVKIKTENKWPGFNCTAGINAGVLYSNGDLFPCELLNKKIGNIRDYNYDFRKIWKSEENKKIRKYIKENKCFCTHENFLTASIFSSPLALFKLIIKILKLK